MQIKSFSFSQEGRNLVLNEAKGRDWPVVYLINIILTPENLF